jgi:hypothetical protein
VPSLDGIRTSDLVPNQAGVGAHQTGSEQETVQ